MGTRLFSASLDGTDVEGESWRMQPEVKAHEEGQQVGQFTPGGSRSPPFWFPLGKSLNRYTSPSGDLLGLVHGSCGESLCACLISCLSW